MLLKYYKNAVPRAAKILTGLRSYITYPVSIIHKSIAGRYRPVSYPDGPITARYRFLKNASWVSSSTFVILDIKPVPNITYNAHIQMNVYVGKALV